MGTAFGAGIAGRAFLSIGFRIFQPLRGGRQARQRDEARSAGATVEKRALHIAHVFVFADWLSTTSMSGESDERRMILASFAASAGVSHWK